LKVVNSIHPNIDRIYVIGIWYIDDCRTFLPGGMSSVTGRIGDAQRGCNIVELLCGGSGLPSADLNDTLLSGIDRLGELGI